MITCINNVQGIGEVCGQATPITVISGIFLATPEQSFSTPAKFVELAEWNTQIAAGKIFPVQNILDEENQDFADKVMETPVGDKVFQFEGKRGKLLKLTLPLELHKILRSYSFANWRIYYLDRNNNLRGTTVDGTIIKGFKLSFFRVLKQKSADASNAAFSEIQLQEANIQEWDVNGIYANPAWLGSDLQGVLSVVATASAIAANAFTLTVNYVDNSGLTPAGANNTAAITGLLAANIQIIKSGSVVTPTSVTPIAGLDGEYTVTCSALTAPATVQVIATNANLYRSNVLTLA
jgi:hypothetical protein